MQCCALAPWLFYLAKIFVKQKYQISVNNISFIKTGSVEIIEVHRGVLQTFERRHAADQELASNSCLTSKLCVGREGLRIVGSQHMWPDNKPRTTLA